MAELTHKIARGAVTGVHARAATAGMRVMANGGNAVDGAVAAALVTAVVNPHTSGIAGYGGAMMIYLEDGSKTIAIDFDGEAPAAAREDMFEIEEDPNQGYAFRVKNGANLDGYLSFTAPGTLAGLHRASTRYGKLPFADMVQIAIDEVNKGTAIGGSEIRLFEEHRKRLSRYPDSSRLYLPGGNPPARGSTFINRELAQTFEVIRDKGVGELYRGSLAKKIAEDSQRNGGILVYEDMAAYQARELAPLSISIEGREARTVPLPAGGASVLQALMVASDCQQMLSLKADDPAIYHLFVETLGQVWLDRLTLMGDPCMVKDPTSRLLSPESIREQALRVAARVREGRSSVAHPAYQTTGGTTHLSTADLDGNMVALTQTHGTSYGSRIIIPELGIFMSGGMSRFDPSPGTANSIGPRKRPLHNMCPTLVMKDGHAETSLGGAGGRLIVSSMFQILRAMLSARVPLSTAMHAPVVHYEGVRPVIADGVPPEGRAYLQRVGYRTIVSRAAGVRGITLDRSHGTFEVPSWNRKGPTPAEQIYE